MFISGQKIGEEDVVLYKVLKNIRQINNALNGIADRQSGHSDLNATVNLG
jgi:hypothetical protein